MAETVADGDAGAARAGRQSESKAKASAGAFRNSDHYLRKMVPRVAEERKALGMEGLVGGLEFITINVEPMNLRPAVAEFLGQTGYDIFEAFSSESGSTCVLECKGSADILVTTRARGKNPYARHNDAPKAAHLPGTRLETFAFSSRDVGRYLEIQSGRGAKFMTTEPFELGTRRIVQTVPSRCTGTSTVAVQKPRGRGSYMGDGDDELDLGIEKPDAPHLKKIGFLDHTASRVHAEDRDEAILEFMRLTNFNFDFAIYVERLNSITNVARLSAGEFAMVFTSGITPYREGAVPGPTESYIRNYGTRVHHMAFSTENIEETFGELVDGGMRFLTKLVGSSAEGIKQAFSVQSPSTLLVSEYIHRYGGFDGFFTKSNVTDLTRATGKQ